MSILPGAHDFVINGGDFRTTHTTHIRYGPSGIDTLLEASSPGAAVDSRERSDRRCFPGTREQYITDIANWAAISDSDKHPPIYWMRGPAGVGKSSIAQTCAENLKSAGLLGAAFFFAIKKYDNPSRLFTTLAYQLSTVLPDYRAILGEKIYKDKTLVEKKLSSQFHTLIVEPLQELEKQGKGVRRKAVFIDGLDECASEDAQVEIIEIIASSVATGSTPFCWAIFSRPEPRITSIFTQDNVSLVTRFVELPISRDADREVELYLRGEFHNILRRRNCLQLSSSWPTDEDLKKLVDAAAGLFAHPAAVLRYVAYPSDWQFKQRLQTVLATISQPSTLQSTSQFAELDALYFLIMGRIPKDVLSSAQLLFCWIALGAGFGTNQKRVAMLCCQLGFSESVFRGICHQLHAVIAYQEFPESLSSLDPRIDFTRSFFDQDQSFQFSASLKNKLLAVHGYLSFHHKSFYDFLVDPGRSSTFCVTTPAIREKLLDRCVQQLLHSASNYAIQNSRLVLALGVTSPSASLPWPQGSEFVDSFIRFATFVHASLFLSHDEPWFTRLLDETPSNCLQKLAELDYRKQLVAAMMVDDLGIWINNVSVVGHAAAGIAPIDRSIFRYIHKDKYDVFDPTEFLVTVKKLEKAGAIRPYHPQLGSTRAASLLHTIVRQKPVGRNYGLYKLGRGDGAVIWYWEFDTEKRYFHDFQTVNHTEAMKIYRTEREVHDAARGCR